MNKALAAVLAIGLQAGLVSAQRYTAPLPDTIGSGFYKVVLTPAITGRSMPGMPDIRLVDSSGHQVPYVLTTDPPMRNGTGFLNFLVLSFARQADRQTHLIIQSTAATPVTSLALKLRNTEAQRSVTISGSNDRTHWFVIKEGAALNEAGTGQDSFTMVALSIPKSNYRYYDVTILGKDLLPPSIVQAGIYQSYSAAGSSLRIPAPTISQHDSNGHSYIDLHYDAPYRIDYLHLSIGGPKYYHRKAWIGTAENSSEAAFMLSSDKPTLFPIDLQQQDIRLAIENGDSPPLHIDSVAGFQNNTFLLTYLEGGKRYRLTFGDSTLSAPSYDLSYFKDSALVSAAVLMPGSLSPYPTNAVKVAPAKTPPNRVLLWVTIIVVCLGVLFLSLRMMQQMKGSS